MNVTYFQLTINIQFHIFIIYSAIATSGNSPTRTRFIGTLDVTFCVFFVLEDYIAS